MRRILVWTTACTLAGLMMVVGVTDVSGAPFKGQIRVLTKMPKAYYKKAAEFKRFIASHTTKEVFEDGEDKSWRFNIMAFFKKKLNDNEVTLMFYHNDKFVDSQVKMTRNFGSDTLLCSVRLYRPPFDAETTYEVVAQTSDGTRLATGRFTTRGTTQAQLDQEKRTAHEMEEMQKSMEDLKKKAEEQKRREEEGLSGADDEPKETADAPPEPANDDGWDDNTSSEPEPPKTNSSKVKKGCTVATPASDTSGAFDLVRTIFGLI